MCDSANEHAAGAASSSGPASATASLSRSAPAISSSRRGPGQRVDRPALPREAADDRRRAERAGVLGGREGADDVAAPADADAEDARGARERQGSRPATGSRTSSPPPHDREDLLGRRARTRRRRAPACPRTGRSRWISHHERQPP